MYNELDIQLLAIKKALAAIDKIADGISKENPEKAILLWGLSSHLASPMKDVKRFEKEFTDYLNGKKAMSYYLKRFTKLEHENSHIRRQVLALKKIKAS